MARLKNKKQKVEKLSQTDQNYKELKWNGQLSWKAQTIKPHSEKKKRLTLRKKFKYKEFLWSKGQNKDLQIHRKKDKVSLIFSMKSESFP